MARRILFITQDVNEAATRYRALHYFDRLRQAGYEPELASVTRRRWSWLKLRGQIRDASITVLVRPLPIWPVPMLLRHDARKLIYTVDDAIYVWEDGSTHPRRQRRFASITRRCDTIWAGNDELAAQARQFNANVIVVPTAVEVDQYAAVKISKPTDSFDLVWIGSSATRKYLEMILPTLESAASELPQLRLKIIADFDLPTGKLRTKAVRWSEATEAMELASSHVGIAPLPDQAWTRGKCGLKVIQCMAAGLPMIASPVSVQNVMVRSGENGYLAATPQQWIDAIKALARDEELRRSYGRAGAAIVEAHYSHRVVFDAMLKSIEALM